MAKSITLRQLHEWLNKPDIKKYTWCLAKGGAFSKEGRDLGGSPVMKYLDLTIDLRTYDIFAIKARSFIPETTVTHCDGTDDQTILDVLEEKIKEYLEIDYEN